MEYCFLEKLVLRTPLKPVKFDFNEEGLIELFKSDFIRDSLFISSPHLLEEYDRYIKNDHFEEKRKDKLIYSLAKYASRIHNRATPFGLFSGCSVVQFGKQTEIVIDHNKNDYHHRSDMNVVFLSEPKFTKFEKNYTSLF